MGWKNWSYAKRGLLIGVVIWLVLNLVSLINQIVSGLPPNSLQLFLSSIVYILGFPAVLIGGALNYGGAGFVGVILFYIGTLICFALWGALIGWIIKKIKKK